MNQELLNGKIPENISNTDIQWYVAKFKHFIEGVYKTHPKEAEKLISWIEDVVKEFLGQPQKTTPNKKSR